MQTNRRDFIKATAAAGVLGTSTAQADANSPWICFLHSTRLHPKWQKSFFDGLAQYYVGDPEVNTPNVNILFHHAAGKYQSQNTSNGNLQNAVRNMISEVNSKPVLFVAAGGMVSALAANGNTGTIPILVIMGRKAAFNNGLKVGGWYIDDTASNNINITLSAKAQKLRDVYLKQYSTQWLIYNANSNMGKSEANEWQGIIGVAGQSIDASYNSTDNDSLNLRKAFRDAVQGGAQAVVLSGDPQFTTQAHRIVRYAKEHAGLVVCYPFQEYDTDAQDAGMSIQTDYMIYGPDLGKVYNKLGALAGQYINNNTTTLSLSLLPFDDPSNPYYRGK